MGQVLWPTGRENTETKLGKFQIPLLAEPSVSGRSTSCVETLQNRMAGQTGSCGLTASAEA
jgi:hypothetical protein